jgi:hypothetical protein
MEGGYSVILGISLAILVSGVTWSIVAARLLLRRRFDLVDIFLLAFGTVYGVAYAFVIYSTQSGSNPGGFRIIGLEGSYWIVPVLALVCALATTALSGAAQQDATKLQKVRAGTDDGLSESAWHAPLFALACLFLGTAMAASYLYTRAYGGIDGFFEVAGALRAGLFEEAGSNSLSFLKPFGGFSIFSTYLFAATCASAGGGRRLWSILGFLASLGVSSVTLLGWGGRVDLLVYWTTVVFGIFVYRVGLAPRLLGGAAALVLAFIVLLPPLTDAMNPGKSRDSYTEFFAAELTFPVESSLNSLELPAYRYGVDILAAPLFVLPERIWGALELRHVSDINSEALQGDALRDGWGYTIPADFITFGLYQFGYAGPLIVIILWCLLLVKLDDLLVRRLPRSISAFLYAHSVFAIAALSTLYVDPKMQIARNFHFILGLVCVLLIPKLWSMARLRGRAGGSRASHGFSGS